MPAQGGVAPGDEESRRERFVGGERALSALSVVPAEPALELVVAVVPASELSLRGRQF